MPREWRAELTQLWANTLIFTSSLFVLRALQTWDQTTVA